MGLALDTVSGTATAPGSTLTAWTMAAGDSAQIRNGTPGKRITLLESWAKNQAAGVLRIRSPKMHDNVQGLRATVTASEVAPLQALGCGTAMYPVDTLTIEQSGSSTAGQIETGSLLVYYEDLPGVASRLIDVPTLQKRLIDLMDLECDITAGTGGGYSGSQAINATFDNLQAGYDYAILGGLVDTRCGSACVRGPDTGNLRVAFPGEPTMRDVTERWFYLLAQQFNMALIPTFAANNKGNTQVDVTQDQAGAAVKVTLLLARLSTP